MTLRELYDEADKVMSEHIARVDAFFADLTTLYHRQNYRTEREHPEFVDLGGES